MLKNWVGPQRTSGSYNQGLAMLSKGDVSEMSEKWHSIFELMFNRVLFASAVTWLGQEGANFCYLIQLSKVRPLSP